MEKILWKQIVHTPFLQIFYFITGSKNEYAKMMHGGSKGATDAQKIA